MAENKRERWNSSIGFILATVGSAVGLGNIWRFPTVVVRSGGGAFVLLFLVIVLVIGVPLIMAELTLGRRSQKNIVSTFSTLAPGTKWWIVGALTILSVFLILSFYSVIAGWAAIYFFGSLFGLFAPLDTAGLTLVYNQIAGHPFLPVLGQVVFLTVTVLIVISGITKGIERWSKVLMPGIIIILFVLLGRTLLLEGAPQGVMWFLRPDLEMLNLKTALDAVGQVFFSFSLGMGAILTYGSYLSPEENIPKNALLIGLSDVAIALLAGLIVVPALFVFNVEPEVGAGIVFVTLPAIFNTLPGSIIWSSLFFLMLSFAAVTSSVSLLEVSVAYLVDEKKWKRAYAAAGLGILTFLVGIPSALAQGVLADRLFLGRNILDFIDFITSSIFLPLGGLLIVVFLAWVWGTQNALTEIHLGSPNFRWGRPWAFTLRFIIPPAIIYIFINGFF